MPEPRLLQNFSGGRAIIVTDRASSLDVLTTSLNRLGVTTCALVRVDGLRVFVSGLDAIDGTPVLDIKPYMSGLGPRGVVREPAWALELMRDYW